MGHGCDKDDPIAPQPWTNQVGAYTGYIVGPNEQGVRFAEDVGSFGVMEVSDTSMSFYIVDENGATIYTSVLVEYPVKKSLRG